MTYTLLALFLFGGVHIINGYLSRLLDRPWWTFADALKVCVAILSGFALLILGTMFFIAGIVEFFR